MDTRHHGNGLRGRTATLHVALAALGLLALLAVVAWSAWANTMSERGLRCQAEGGRMTWSGCAMPQAARIPAEKIPGDKVLPGQRSAAAR